MATRAPRRALVAALVLAGCAADATGPRIDAVAPAYGPLVGGTHVAITGAGFAADGAAPNRVLIGGRLAPLAVTVDDATLEVIIPPGTRPGDATVEVLNAHGATAASGRFHYSAPPTIATVVPRQVLAATGGTVTVTGSGFLDEDAGEVTVVIDGHALTEVEVVNDTTLRFAAPPGRALLEPTLEVVDLRGRVVRPRALRYTPSARPGLLLFPGGGVFAVFFDPVDRTSVTIPAIASAPRLTAVVRDARGAYWGIDRSRRFGRLDLGAQTLDAPQFANGWFPALERIGDAYLAVERGSQRFGRFDPATGGFTPIGTATLPCCGSYGLATDGATYLVARQAGSVEIAPLDPATGTLGPAVPLTGAPALHVEDMRFFAGVLYATSRDGTVVTIDPGSGAVAVVATGLGRFHAMEVYDPAAAP